MASGQDYERRDRLVIRRDTLATTLASSTLDHQGKQDLRIALIDAKDELKRLPST